jgi:type IV pilus assembly protein PilA
MNRRERSSERRMGKRASLGFSLIELLVVVAILLIVAAIAIPNLVRSKISAHESSATGSIRVINTAEFTYYSTWGIGYAATLNKLGGSAAVCGGGATSANACLIDDLLSVPPYLKSSYIFGAAGTIPDPGGNPQGFEVTATPAAYQLTGVRSFCSDHSGVIRFAINGGVPIPPPCNAVGIAPGVSGPIGN